MANTAGRLDLSKHTFQVPGLHTLFKLDKLIQYDWKTHKSLVSADVNNLDIESTASDLLGKTADEIYFALER